MNQPRPLPNDLRTIAFSTAEAQRRGVTRSRLRRHDLSAPFHAVRAPSEIDPGDIVGRCRAYTTVLAAGAFFSHTTAAALYGLPLPRHATADPRLHVSTVHPTRAPKGRGIAGHSVRQAPMVVMLDGLPVPQPAEVWVQLGALLASDDLVAVGDALTRRKSPLATVRELQRASQDATGRPGVSRLRDAVTRVRARTDSPMETVLRLAIVRAGLPEPQVNYAIADRTGRRIAHGDLVFPIERVVVEYDGDQHRTDQAQYWVDIDRLWNIESLGWRVIRINRTHLRDGARVALARIASALRTSGPDTP